MKESDKMSKKLQGITIEIDGNTTKLNAALKTVDKTIITTNKELNSLRKDLKFNPDSTVLATQKQELLNKSIQETSEKLKILKEAQKQMGNYNNLTEEQKTNYRELAREIERTENNIKMYKKELNETSKIDFSKLKSSLEKVGQVSLKVTQKIIEVTQKIAQIGIVATSAITGIIAGIVSAGVKAYAEYEQLEGGIETIFGKDANFVIKNAENAYKTAGVSANEYLNGVISFSASLKQAVGGNTKEAAEVADMAFKDMSDNANKMGTDMESIQNAYQGFAKQNYTMLDNLKLGYGGTKTEMERLLADAEKISGVKYNINNLSDVYKAIHVIQGELKITGTTQKEAMNTISGSMNMLKKSWENLITGLGRDDVDFGSLTNGLVESIIATTNNLLPRIKNVLSGVVKLTYSLIDEIIPKLFDEIGPLVFKEIPEILKLVENIIKEIVNSIDTNLDSILEVIDLIFSDLVTTALESLPQLANLIGYIVTYLVNIFVSELPKIVECGLNVIIELISGINDGLPQLLDYLPIVIENVVNCLTENLPILLETGIQMLMTLIQGISNCLPNLMLASVDVLLTMVDTLIDNIDLVVDTAIQLILALVDGILIALPRLIDKAPEIIQKLVGAIIRNTPKLLVAAGEIIVKLNEGLMNCLPKILNFVITIPNKIAGEIVKGLPNLIDVGGKLMSGLVQGLKDKWNQLKGNVENLGTKIVDKFKSVFGIHSPSRVMKQQIGENLGLGIAEGIEDTIVDVEGALKNLSGKVQASVNPVINPTANTNPLIIQIDKFVNERESSIQQLAQELEFYRRNSAQARGGN